MNNKKNDLNFGHEDINFLTFVSPFETKMNQGHVILALKLFVA